MLRKFMTVFFACFPFFLIAQDSLDAEQESLLNNANRATSKPYEIVVRPLISRAGLRDLIADVEEDFYKKFNELNIDDNYDIVCYKHTPTMSHIWRRVCEPLFMLRTRGDMASNVMFLLGSPSPSARASGMASLKSERQLLVEGKRDFEILQQLMEEFSRSDSEFRNIGEALADLKDRLENYGKED